jgi:FkbM family methyltransferase
MTKSLRAYLPDGIKRTVRAEIQNRLRLGSGYSWQGAPSIRRQTFEFAVADRLLTVASDYRTPVYETIHEVVDYDCYQLARLGAPPADSCVVDVGANIGITALVLRAKLGLPVYSFEPMTDNVERLRENIAENGLEDSIRAIGGKTGTALADVTWEASVSARVGTELRLKEGTPTASVRMLSLQDALSQVHEPIFLVKLDCEGAEFEIVDQITSAQVVAMPNLTFEVHDQDSERNVRTLRAQLERLGYTTTFKSEMRGRSTMHHLFATTNRSSPNGVSNNEHDQSI